MSFSFLFLPLITLLTFGLSAWGYLMPTHIGWVVGSAAVAFVLAAWSLGKTRPDWWQFSLLPLLLFGSGATYALMIPNTAIVIATLAVSALLQIFYWRYFYMYMVRPAAYPAFSLERLSFYLNFLIVFCTAAAAFGLRIFLDIPIGVLTGAFAAIMILVIYQWIWISKVEWSQAWRYLIILSVIMVELFLACSFFSLDFHVLGFLLATSYYGLSSLLAEHLAHKLSPRKAQVIISIIIVCWLAVFLTARWL